jgi:DNA polymerase-1
MGKSFYIIDGHAQIFRAFYAPFRELSSSKGEPTKATYVFTQMLLNLIAQRKPEYLAMVIDSGDEYVFRKEFYPDYKANRQATPVDLEPQEKRILQIVKDAGIPVFARTGFEADDLIATMAKKLCDQDWDIVVVSKDKDLRQLINDCTRLYDVQSDTFTDAAKMETDLGYGPGEAIEVQSLMGDNIDNVPGIPGVGEKTAAKLIKKYGRAEAVLEHLEELTPKLRENFEKFGTNIAMARRLVTLKNDVEFEFDPEACKFLGVDLDAIKPHLEELGFTALLKRLGLQEGGPQSQEDVNVARRIPARKRAENFQESLFDAPAQENAPIPFSSTDCDYRLITNERDFTDFLAELKKQKRFAFDTETDALGAMNSNLIGLSFSWKEAGGWYVPVRGPAGCEHLPCEKVLAALKTVLEDAKVGKIGHNIKYDLLVMRNAGINLRGIEMDTMIAAFLLDASRMQFGIDQLARDLLNFKKIATRELIGREGRVSMHRLPLEQVARYAAEDADVAWRLGEMLRGKMKEIPALGKLNDELETPLIDVVAEMEFNGVAIDAQILKQQSEVLGARAETLRGEIMDAAGCNFNPDSTKQLADVLFNKLGLKVIKKNKTGPSTDVMVLERLAAEHKCPRLILEYRSLVKLKNTYLDNLTDYVNPRTNRIHASFNQTGAATGRLSCSDPNLQNIPIRTDEGRRIRLAFVAGGEQKVLLTADYSQIELRVLAHFTHEPALIRAFEADEDIHRAVAAEVFNVALDQVSREQRGQAKTINFGIIYGVSAMGLARRIEGLTVRAADDLINAYNRRFPSILKFMDKCVMDAQAQGYVETIMGRRRRIPELSSPVLAQRNAGERMAINSVVQGSAADLIKKAMVNIYRRLEKEKRPTKLLMQVHDELVFETPAKSAEEEAKMIREEMNSAMTLRVPLKVEVGWGKNWQEVK